MMEQTEDISELTQEQIDALSDEDLTAFIDEGKTPESAAVEAEPEPEPVAEPEEAEAKEEVAPEPEPEEKPEPEPESEIDFELEQAKLEAEEARKRAAHFESKLGQFTGKMGYLEQEIARLQAERRQQAQAGEDYVEQPVAQPAPIPQIAPEIQIQTAIGVVGAELKQAHPDAWTEDGTALAPDLLQELEKPSYVARWQQAMLKSPEQCVEEVRGVVSDAYYATDINRTALARQELERRRADQAKRLIEQKRATAVSASGGVTAEPRPKAKTLDEMSDEELAALSEAAADW